MGPRPLPWTRAPAVTPGPPKPQGGTLARNHCSKPTPGRYMAGRSCPSGSNLAQRRFSKPMPRSDSGVRAAKPNATRMETIRRHRRRSQAHRLLHGSACARLPSRCAQQARRNRHGGTPKRNNSKRHGSSAHSDPQSRHVTRQKGSCLLPPPARQQSRAEKATQIRKHMRHSRRELWTTAGRWKGNMCDNRTPGSDLPKLSDVA